MTGSSRVHSMTGYGRGEAPLGPHTISAEVRTVNSRFLDVRVRLSRDLAALEQQVRGKASGYFKRGQVELTIRISTSEAGSSKVEIDPVAARRYAADAEKLRKSLSLEGALDLATLLGLPGVARQRDPEVVEEEALQPILEALSAACEQALQMRQREGAALEADLRQRLGTLETVFWEIESRSDELLKGARERLEKRLAVLAPDLELDPARVAQEVVIHADRMDVTEETVRLRSHAAQFRDALGATGPVGRKLEFLLQEIGREVNTIGSKAGDAPLSSLVVDLKTELEKLREQVLNIE